MAKSAETIASPLQITKRDSNQRGFERQTLGLTASKRLAISYNILFQDCRLRASADEDISSRVRKSSDFRRKAKRLSENFVTKIFDTHILLLRLFSRFPRTVCSLKTASHLSANQFSMNFCGTRCRKVWTFQTESRKKARKLIVERLMGSSPVWFTNRSFP